MCVPRPPWHCHSGHGLPHTGPLGLWPLLVRNPVYPLSSSCPQVDLCPVQLSACCGGADHHGGGAGPKETSLVLK